jgi:exodeoxyribonuclease VII large subunit
VTEKLIFRTRQKLGVDDKQLNIKLLVIFKPLGFSCSSKNQFFSQGRYSYKINFSITIGIFNMLTTSTKIFTVSELTYSIKSLLEGQFNQVSIKGEISNFKKQSSGHIYFSLKDKESQISAALFKGNVKNLSRLPKDGDQVIAIGEISVYPPRGNYQIIVREIQFLGIGELLLKLHELKQELQLKGFFDPEHKKKIPPLPRTIGVVTSPTGAVIQDILNVLKRRFFNFHLILNPVKVQGEGAAEEIAQAIDDFNKFKLADVLIIGRGGGSLEDLWPFNEKIVAEAIYRSEIPIISAIGHETDTTIADFVADVRAPTPSAAAEMVISEKSHLLKNILYYEKQLLSSITVKITQHRNHIFYLLKHPVFSSSSALLSKYFQLLDEERSSIEIIIKHILDSKKNLYISYVKQLKALNPKNQIYLLKEKLHFHLSKIDMAIKSNLLLHKRAFNKELIFSQCERLIYQAIKSRKDNLQKLLSHLKSIDPKNLLKKGYSILFSEIDNSIILSAKEVASNQPISALMHDGKIKAKVVK